MNALLTDPWFEAEFYGQVTDYSYSTAAWGFQYCDWCPCGYGLPVCINERTS